ncbi:MAG TPA: tripartite tricarboxylate transporter substrate-binding protein, partial [Xanthobacteraceae bacterium]|nr:tripartite tricarboxylate transporter substrate-binding protein [Xanthobacteraceae bacterium]
IRHHDVIRYREPARDLAALVERLHDADVVVSIRERVEFSRALLVPAHTPPEMVARLNTAAVAALKEPAVRARLAELGFDVVGGTPEQLTAVMRAEFARMGELIRAANIRE